MAWGGWEGSQMWAIVPEERVMVEWFSPWLGLEVGGDEEDMGLGCCWLDEEAELCGRYREGTFSMLYSTPEFTEICLLDGIFDFVVYTQFVCLWTRYSEALVVRTSDTEAAATPVPRYLAKLQLDTDR